MIAALALSLAVAPPPNAVELKWKFTAGDTFYQTTVTKTKTTTILSGAEIELESTCRTVSKVVVKSVSNKETVLESTVVQYKLEAKSSVPGAIRSDDGDGLLGSTFTLTMDDRHRINKVEGLDAFLDKASAGDAAKKATLRERYTEQSLKSVMNPGFYEPGKRVTPGNTWVEEQVLGLGPVGDRSLTRTLTYKYVGPVGGKEKVTYSGRLKWDPTAVLAGPVTVTKADVKAEMLEGTRLFDRAIGRPVEATETSKTDVKFTYTTAGQEHEIANKQEVTTTQTWTAGEPKKE
jgi:Family of unknown function (DUF6263)